MQISAKRQSSPREFPAYGEWAANNVLRFELIALCNSGNGSPFLPRAERRNRDLLFHATVARARVHLRSRIPTDVRRFVHRPLLLPPSRARHAFGSRKSLQKLRRRASWLRRTGARAASAKS